MKSIITKHKMDLGERKDMENALAESEEMRAFLDYNIMMGNIEDPGEEGDEE